MPADQSSISRNPIDQTASCVYSHTMIAWMTQWGKKSTSFVEQILAAGIIVGVLVFSVSSTLHLIGMDWQDSMTFYDLVYRVLLMVIGLEMARTLLTHDLKTILELLAFVVARKMLNPDITSIDIILSVISFVALLGAYRFFLIPNGGGGQVKDRITC